jgi:hypothetical protein
VTGKRLLVLHELPVFHAGTREQLAGIQAPVHAMASIFACTGDPTSPAHGTLHDSEVDRPGFPEALDSLEKTH